MVLLPCVSLRKAETNDLRMNTQINQQALLHGKCPSLNREVEDGMKEVCKENCPELEDESNDISVYLQRRS